MAQTSHLWVRQPTGRPREGARELASGWHADNGSRTVRDPPSITRPWLKGFCGAAEWPDTRSGALACADAGGGTDSIGLASAGLPTPEDSSGSGRGTGCRGHTLLTARPTDPLTHHPSFLRASSRGTPGDRNSALQTVQTNSPTVSNLTYAPEPDTRAAEFTWPGDGFPSQDRHENPRRAQARDRAHRPGSAVMS
jgi:hypothetical protein